MSKPSHRQLVVAAVVAAVAVAFVAVVILYLFRDQIPPIGELRTELQLFLASIPAPLYFIAFVILPAFGVPLSLFYLTALAVLGSENIFVGLAIGLLAVALNMIFTNLITRGFLHPVIEWVIRHRHLSIPKIKPENEWKLVTALRVSPIPFALQNYLLALGHCRWRYYLGLSIIVQGSIGITIMMVGESILKGGLGYILLAIFAFLMLNLIIDHFRKRLGKDRATADG
jgi:uncharacterized membrane protein YdjX (TVP38/TMEM64 family)